MVKLILITLYLMMVLCKDVYYTYSQYNINCTIYYILFVNCLIFLIKNIKFISNSHKTHTTIYIINFYKFIFTKSIKCFYVIPIYMYITRPLNIGEYVIFLKIFMYKKILNPPI